MSEFLKMAKDAIEVVKKIQSCNTAGAMITDRLGLTDHAKNVGKTQLLRPTTFYGDPHYKNTEYASKILDSGYGNCADKTDVAIQFLNNNHGNKARFTKCSSIGYDHAFLVIHTGGNLNYGAGNTNDRTAFGDDAVLVDSWQHDYYYLNGYPTINPKGWWIGPFQAITRYKIWSNQIHVLATNETI
ncbi:hypothetical protein [Jeongeupia sp. USM3]|uniref:hypothetical protein n=1 Tax=Jeongeupia sp. USM3 TaxID=1906741 RepID=UPI0011AB3E6C|nr:hypothetical protein [Jeongeupia sp. USM3]